MKTKFFTDILTHDGSWERPAFPPLNDKGWREAFSIATDKQKRDIANMWCWRFNEEFADKMSFIQMERVTQHYKWLKDIKPFATQYADNAVSPYAVVAEYLKSKQMNLNVNACGEVKQLIDTLWFSDDPDRTRVINPLVGLLGGRSSKRRLPGKEFVRLAQFLAWDAISEVSQPDPFLLADGARLSIMAGQLIDSRDSHHDPRAIAWHAVAAAFVSNDANFLKVRGVDALKVVRDMHPVAALDGTLMLLYQTGGESATDQKGFLRKPSIFAEAKEVTAHAYDVLAFLVPQRKGLWATAHALDMHTREAVKQVYAELKKSSPQDVELPHDFTAS